MNLSLGSKYQQLSGFFCFSKQCKGANKKTEESSIKCAQEHRKFLFGCEDIRNAVRTQDGQNRCPLKQYQSRIQLLIEQLNSIQSNIKAIFLIHQLPELIESNSKESTIQILNNLSVVEEDEDGNGYENLSRGRVLKLKNQKENIQKMVGEIEDISLQMKRLASQLKSDEKKNALGINRLFFSKQEQQDQKINQTPPHPIKKFIQKTPKSILKSNTQFKDCGNESHSSSSQQQEITSTGELLIRLHKQPHNNLEGQNDSLKQIQVSTNSSNKYDQSARFKDIQQTNCEQEELVNKNISREVNKQINLQNLPLNQNFNFQNSYIKEEKVKQISFSSLQNEKLEYFDQHNQQSLHLKELTSQSNQENNNSDQSQLLHSQNMSRVSSDFNNMYMNQNSTINQNGACSAQGLKQYPSPSNIERTNSSSEQQIKQDNIQTNSSSQEVHLTKNKKESQIELLYSSNKNVIILKPLLKTVKFAEIVKQPDCLKDGKMIKKYGLLYQTNNITSVIKAQVKQIQEFYYLFTLQDLGKFSIFKLIFRGDHKIETNRLYKNRDPINEFTCSFYAQEAAKSVIYCLNQLGNLEMSTFDGRDFEQQGTISDYQFGINPSIVDSVFNSEEKSTTLLIKTQDQLILLSCTPYQKIEGLSFKSKANSFPAIQNKRQIIQIGIDDNKYHSEERDGSLLKIKVIHNYHVIICSKKNIRIVNLENNSEKEVFKTKEIATFLYQDNFISIMDQEQLFKIKIE